MLFLVLAPILVVFGAGAGEALRMTETIGPRLTRLVQEPTAFDAQLRDLPGYSFIAPYREQIVTKAGELLGSASAYLFEVLSATTRATAVFVFHWFVLLYAMFFFLTDGPQLSRRSEV